MWKIKFSKIGNKKSKNQKIIDLSHRSQGNFYLQVWGNFQPQKIILRWDFVFYVIFQKTPLRICQNMKSPKFCDIQENVSDTKSRVSNSVKCSWFLLLSPITYSKTEYLAKLDPPDHVLYPALRWCLEYCQPEVRNAASSAWQHSGHQTLRSLMLPGRPGSIPDIKV